MGESINHIQLVENIYKWVSQSLFNGSGVSILVDRPESRIGERPPTISGFIPDLYVENAPDKLLVIGEAKTYKDLERKRSREQFEAFLKKCKTYDNSILVAAVPWDYVNLAKSILKNLKKKVGAESVRVKVLNQLEF
ncbi:hypothetical protein HN682_00560 [Candidatus Peregrinibacteria bacterium]|jgi:hypothetical protein|nr:hypothetical protein [Candidatus Peregrinibacteria bacterium]